MPLSKLSQKLRELRKSHDYTQAYVADYLGITRQGYSHYEADARVPDYQSLLKLTLLYDISIDELINSESIPLGATQSLQESKNYHTDKTNQTAITLSNSETKLIIDFRALKLDKQKSLRQFMEFLKQES